MASRDARTNFRVVVARRLFWFGLSLEPWFCALTPTQAAGTIQSFVDTYADGAVVYLILGLVGDGIEEKKVHYV